jgi:hypothetical protein
MTLKFRETSGKKFSGYYPRQRRGGDRPLVFFGGETDKEEISSPAVVEHLEEYAATEVEIPAEFLDEITQGKSILKTEKVSLVLCVDKSNLTYHCTEK